MVIWHMDTRDLKMTHLELLFGALNTSLFKFSLFLMLSTIPTLFVAANYMHIYAFTVLHMPKIAFKHICGLHMHILTHIYI